MYVRTSLIATLTLVTTFALPLQPAWAQSDQQCSLKVVTEALNNLGCAVSGAYVSADSVVASISETCASTADEETCHACFRKAGGKVGPAFKALAKVKVLSKTTLSQFKIALVTAEETLCAPKDSEEGDDNDAGENYSQPSDSPRGGGAERIDHEDGDETIRRTQESSDQSVQSVRSDQNVRNAQRHQNDQKGQIGQSAPSVQSVLVRHATLGGKSFPSAAPSRKGETFCDVRLFR